MTELGEIFAELGISHYLHDFIEQGFDTWDTILDIKESDFDALGVKLGHRRKLQRRIANSRGLSSDRALESPGHPGTDDRQIDEQKSGVRPDTKDGSSGSGQKRKYRRHPKVDENAPDRPPSAYVIFSNKMREDLKGRNLSFTEIAKLVGEHWQNLLPAEKEPYEQQAFTAKERYNAELAEYKKTDNYRQYSHYLADFKAKQSNQQQPINDSDTAKRPKLEAHPSTASTGTTSSGASGHGIDTPGSSHAGSMSNQGQWQAGDRQSPSHSLGPTKHAPVTGAPKGHGSPGTISSTQLPGYRESIYGGSQQSLPWRDGPREEGAESLRQFSRMASVDRRPSHPGSIDSRNSTGSAQHSHRTGHSSVPPLLSSESTNMSAGSSNSTGSSAFYTPRTPMEPPHERSMPLPSLFSQKSTGHYDNQLPPIRPPSLSPRTTLHGPQQSPTTMHPNIDFQPTIAPLRGYGPPPPQHSPQMDGRPRDQALSPSNDDNLDPVEKLLRASEVLDQNNRKR